MFCNNNDAESFCVVLYIHRVPGYLVTAIFGSACFVVQSVRVNMNKVMMTAVLRRG